MVARNGTAFVIVSVFQTGLEDNAEKPELREECQIPVIIRQLVLLIHISGILIL